MPEQGRWAGRNPAKMGVDWTKVRPDQFETIPFLARLRERILERRARV